MIVPKHIGLYLHRLNFYINNKEYTLYVTDFTDFTGNNIIFSDDELNKSYARNISEFLNILKQNKRFNTDLYKFIFEENIEYFI